MWRATGATGPVAVKLLRPRALESRQRFDREIATLRRLISPHAPRILDAGTHDDALYYVMELVDGIDLQALVARHGPQSAARVVELLRQVTTALAEAHEKGIVHRDLKPANVMLTLRAGRDHAVVIDYGLAGGLGCDLDAGLPTGKALRGTPAYLPPEAITAECEGECDVDGQADVYSLGCLAYWLLSGKLAIDGADAREVAINHVFTRPEPFEPRLAVPGALAELVFGCLEKEPADRPTTSALLAALPSLGVEWSDHDAQQWWSEHNGRRS